MKPKIQIPDKLQPLYDDRIRYLILEGGRGGAKSHGVATSQLLRGTKRPMLFLDAREIQKSIADSVHALLEKKVRELGLQDFYKVLDTEIRGKNGTKFIFAGLRHNVDNIKSIEDVDECWVEEAHSVSDGTWKKLIPTIRKEISPCCFVKLGMDNGDGKPCSKCKKTIPNDEILPSRIVLTYNPDLEDDPTHQRFNVNRPSNSVLIRMNWRDNPWFPNVLRREMEDLRDKNYPEYLNVWEGECKASVEGAVFKDEMQKVKEEGRIMHVPYDKTKPVDTFWDLGRGDKTAIWFAQTIGYEYRILNFYQNNRKHFSHYVKIVKDLPYAYGTHYLPHDAKHEQLAAEKSIEQQAYEAFSNVIIVPKIAKKILSLDAARGIFDACVFDKENTPDGVTCLRKYAYKVDEVTGKTSRVPEHDTPYSDGADAFQCLAMAMQPTYTKPKLQYERPLGPYEI